MPNFDQTAYDTTRDELLASVAIEFRWLGAPVDTDEHSAATYLRKRGYIRGPDGNYIWPGEKQGFAADVQGVIYPVTD